MFYCNELPAVRRVDGVCVCVCAKEDETRFDGISNALSLS